jgi:putative PIN family toxin of toxin-antitoxin system
MRLVLDTNTVISALLWRGVPHRLFAAARERTAGFFTSPVLLAELEEVLGRQKLASAVAASRLTPRQLASRYRGLATVIQPAPIAPTVLADPDDDYVLACALAARADVIVSGDSHLLDLGSYQGMSIVTAATCLRIMVK